MQTTRSMAKQARAADAEVAADAAAAAAPLWPLALHFPALAAEVVRRKLRWPALAALRLVNRAARDDFVDCYTKRVWRRWDDASLEALASAAPRLHSLESLSLLSSPSGSGASSAPMRAEDGAALAKALERLPGGGAALRELRLPPINVRACLGASTDPDDVRSLRRFAAAVARLRGLQVLDAPVSGAWNTALAALVAAADRAPALRELSVWFSFYRWKERRGPPHPTPPPARLLRRLETLRLASFAAPLWLSALLGPDAAAAGAPLPRLRSLEIDVTDADPRRLPPAPWRAPWVGQVARLALRGEIDGLRAVWRALAPGALAGVRALDVRVERRRLEARHLRSLLARCGDAAAIEALSLHHATAAAVRDAAAALPALRALAIRKPDFSAGSGYQAAGAVALADARLAWRDFLRAPLAPLTRLHLDYDARAATAKPAGLAALCAAPWARALRALSLRLLGDPERGAAGRRRGPRGLGSLRKLAPLSALTALRSLALELDEGLGAAALEAAAAKGWAKGWAARLAEFEVRAEEIEPNALPALLRLPFSEQLTRLAIISGGVIAAAEAEAFVVACGAALPQLAELELSAASRAEK